MTTLTAGRKPLSRKHRRLLAVLAGGACLAAAATLVLSALSDNLTFFLAPSDVATKAPAPGRSFRLGGLVEAGSVEKIRIDGKPAAHFKITDGNAAVTVNFIGLLPDLFREGQGVVTLGTMQPDGTFRASEVLAKHDETYMPKEVADALKKQGHWNPAEGKPPTAASMNGAVSARPGG
jgi:cytochrome c-type biogenesis protein CcmE